ncbi:hypothetical protein DITRI_Ditri06bG0029100 [Diplodiscus trichospermus]
MEKDLVISLESDKERLGRDTEFWLVGKLIADIILNRRRVIGVIQSIWKREVKAIKKVEANTYMISFKDKRSIEEAPKSSLWSIMGSCLNLKRWRIDQVIQEINLSKMAIWIQVHKLPLEMMTKKNAEKIEES